MTLELVLPAPAAAAAVIYGREKFDSARRAGKRHRWNRRDEHTVEIEIDALGAEIAQAIALGLVWHWSPLPDPEGDLGPGLQVRHSCHDDARLLVHKEDAAAHVFYLVTGRLPRYRLHGWILGADARRWWWWAEPQPGRPCFAVPQGALVASPDLRGPFVRRLTTPRLEVVA